MFLIKFKPFNNYVPTYCYKVEIIKHKVVIQSKLITIKFALSLNQKIIFRLLKVYNHNDV